MMAERMGEKRLKQNQRIRREQAPINFAQLKADTDARKKSRTIKIYAALFSAMAIACATTHLLTRGITQ